MARLSPSVFKIPTDKLRSGYYSDLYFLRTRDILVQDRRSVEVGYQFFPREDAVICGLDEALAVLKTCAGQYRDPEKARQLYRRLRQAQWKFQDASAREKSGEIHRWQRERAQIRQRLNRLWESGWKKIRVFALRDGDPVKCNEPVLALQGDPRLFVHLETPLLGVIARHTSTATAVSQVVWAARGKQILFFSARFDHYWSQATDGYAALKAGAFGVSTDANADYWGAQSMGTMPHFLIGCFEGNTTDAFLAFDRLTPPAVHRTALVDWDNDCIGTTRNLIERLMLAQNRQNPADVIGPGRGKLWGVRFDTSERLRDRSVRSEKSFGVSPELVKRARREFDRWGCRRLKIIVSGGFDEKKISRFEALKVPVDAYGVGSSLLRHRIDITADIVEVEGKPCAKVGRRKGDWSRLKRVR